MDSFEQSEVNKCKAELKRLCVSVVKESYIASQFAVNIKSHEETLERGHDPNSPSTIAWQGSGPNGR